MCDVVYVSSACNQTPTSAHWGRNNLICYASCNAVIIYDPNHESGGIVIDTLCVHKKRVNSVQWISGPDYEYELVSGSADGTAVVWTRCGNDYNPYILKGHENNINVVESTYTKSSSTLVITTSADSTIRTWFRKEKSGDFFQAQVINLNYGVALSLKLSYLPNHDVIILAAGLDDSNIHIYIEDEEKPEDFLIQFKHCQKLQSHENWVRGLDFKINGEELFMVSCAQDNFIRLWKISPEGRQKEVDLKLNIGNTEQFNFVMKRKEIVTSNEKFVISLESVLAGHEGWVYSVNWHTDNMTFLSSSIDKTMVIWKWEHESNMWLENVRVGEVGGNTLGFYGGMFGPHGKSFMAHGYHGAFHIWKFCEDMNSWEPGVTVGGHFNEVTDLSWEPKGEFLISVSNDQTTRIHAPWAKENSATTWHEIARPQVHGYDIASLAILSRYNFASGADEKVIRVFKAPKNFIENFRRLCNIKNDEEGENILSEEEKPQGAAVPSLGLSNKAIYNEDNIDYIKGDSKKDPYPLESHFTASVLTEPPTEETLIQNTLWPEVQKLYGHGYEIYALASSPDGKILASACKASIQDHAAIILWNTTSWVQIQKLHSHSLTVVQMEFSPDSQYLLSVSRDRRWSLFWRNPSSNEFQLIATLDKKPAIHTRIIWCCSWSFDSKYFATGSRDGKAVIWSQKAGKTEDSTRGQIEHVHIKEFKGESVTAIDFAPTLVCGFYMVAMGFETGTISLYLWSPRSGFRDFLRLDARQAHHLTVRRLRFRPLVGVAGSKTDKEIQQLASCGLDHSVRVYNILLPSSL